MESSLGYSQIYSEFIESLSNYDELHNSFEKEYEEQLKTGFKDKDNVINIESTLSDFSCKNIKDIEKELRKHIEKVWFHYIVTDIEDIVLSSESDDYYSGSSHGVIEYRVKGYVKKESFITGKFMDMYVTLEEEKKREIQKKEKEIEEKKLYLKLKRKYENKGKSEWKEI